MRLTAVTFGVGLLAVGAGIGWVLRPPRGTDEAIPALQNELARVRADRERTESFMAHDTRQHARLPRPDGAATAEERDAAMTQQPTPARAQAPADVNDWRARVARYPDYGLDGASPAVRDALADVDWVAAAESLSAMLPVVGELVAALAHGERPSAASIGRSRELNGPLVTIALRLEAAGVPGTGAGGALTNPAVMSNAIAATLEALGMPLDDAQRGGLERVTAAFTRREQRRIAARPADAVLLASLVEETEQKREYFAAALAVLSDEQRNALCPPAARGRVAADIFSEGLVWAGRAQPLTFDDEAHLAELMETRLLQDVAQPALEAARATIAAWVAALPTEILDREADALDRMGIVDAGYATLCARHVAILLDTLLRRGDLDAEAGARLRALAGTVVPFRAVLE